MTTESDYISMGLCEDRGGISNAAASSVATSDQSSGPGWTRTTSKKSASTEDSIADASNTSSATSVGSSTYRIGSAESMNLFMPRSVDPNVGLEHSTFSAVQERTAAKLERDFMRTRTWHWRELLDSLGKYRTELGPQLFKVSSATRRALLRNKDDYPRSQIEEEAYEHPKGERKTWYRAWAAGDPRARHYAKHPEELVERQSNSQIWCANAPPLEVLPPDGRPFDEDIFSRPQAMNPVPLSNLYSDAGDPLEARDPDVVQDSPSDDDLNDDDE